MTIKAFVPVNFEAFRAVVNNDPEFKKAARGQSLNYVLDMALPTDENNICVQIHDGQLIKYELVDKIFQPESDFSIRANEETWEKIAQEIPPYPFQTIASAMLGRHLSTTGNSKFLLTGFWIVDRMVELIRSFQNPQAAAAEAPKSPFKPGDIEPITGKYVHLEIEGIQYRVYYEESGQGVPLVCQHTAGCDGRQYRSLLGDPEITANFRVIAYDLPYHGKSLPPEGVKWWAEDYLLYRKFLLAFHEAFIKALGLERGVFIGCSMGGQLALNLAIEAPDLYRATIGLGASLIHPSPLGSKLSRARRIVAENICQTSRYPGNSEEKKWETSWIYLQGAPGVLLGDSHYYNQDHDVRETVHLVDPERCACYVMNGEYDNNTDFADGDALVAKNPKIKLIKMDKTGHFGPTENYPAFKKYLMPVLNEINGLYFNH